MLLLHFLLRPLKASLKDILESTFESELEVKELQISDAETQRTVYKALAYRKDCRGRAISVDIPALNLRKYDRLMPTIHLRDVSQFESQTTPFIASFWRMTRRDRVFHGCPLLTLGIPGVDYEKWAVDGLHSWALGGLGATIALGLQFAMKSPVFRPACVHVDAADIDRLALNHIKALLMTYYRRKKRENPDWKKKGKEVFR